MTPKSKIDFVDLNDDTKNNELTIRTTEHDFLPVCDKNFSNIYGIIKIKTILKSFEADFNVIECLKKTCWNLTTYLLKPLINPITKFQKNKKKSWSYN